MSLLNRGKADEICNLLRGTSSSPNSEEAGARLIEAGKEQAGLILEYFKTDLNDPELALLAAQAYIQAGDDTSSAPR